MFVHTNNSVVDKSDSKYCSCLYFSANALARVMTRMGDEIFAKVGLSSSYAILLMTVSEHAGIQPKAICQQMQLTPSTVTRLIEKMEHRGLLERRRVGRTTEVYPTEACLALQPQIKAAWAELNERHTQILGESFSRELTANIYEAAKQLD